MHCRRAFSHARMWTPLAALVTSVLVGLALIWTPVAAFADGTNLLSNPGCENGTNYFSGYASTIAGDTTVKHSGAASCKATSTGGFYTLESTQSYPNPAQGRTFTASAWVRAASAAGQNLYAALRERGGSTADRTVYSTGVSLSTTWQLVSVSITVGSANRAALDFYLTQYPGSTGQSFYADDMTFQLNPTSPSGQAMPVGDLPGWHQIATEDFTVDAATGSWGSSCSQSGASSKVVYVGATGTRWHTYPDCFKDTTGRPYRSDQVLSVHDGVLDFNLHNVNGQAAGANPSPVLDNTANSAYQTYGRYTYRFRTDGSVLSEYKVAWLLWPSDDTQGKCAESDFPEAGLNVLQPGTVPAADRNRPERHRRGAPVRGLGGGLLLPARGGRFDGAPGVIARGVVSRAGGGSAPRCPPMVPWFPYVIERKLCVIPDAPGAGISLTSG